jgi:hypothetical protein
MTYSLLQDMRDKVDEYDNAKHNEFHEQAILPFRGYSIILFPTLLSCSKFLLYRLLSVQSHLAWGLDEL